MCFLNLFITFALIVHRLVAKMYISAAIEQVCYHESKIRVHICIRNMPPSSLVRDLGLSLLASSWMSAFLLMCAHFIPL